MQSRRDMLEKATIDCLDEMYRKSQPSITWDEVIKQSKENKNRQIWQEHYLPQRLYVNILEKYMNMYRIKEEWTDNINLLEDYLKSGGTRDKYIPETVDPDGRKHPGYRGYERVDPIVIQIKNYLNSQGVETPDGLALSITDMIMRTISDCKNFYVHNRDEVGFRIDVSNYSPCSNIETVREFYKDTDTIIEEIVDDEEEDIFTLA